VELSPDEKVELAKDRLPTPPLRKSICAGGTAWASYLSHTISRADLDSAINHSSAPRAWILILPGPLGLGGCYINRILKGLGEANDYEKAQDAFNKALAHRSEIASKRACT